ncbi:MAG: YfhO family protein [Bacteroidales bacterium]|nr:YfhO family protein [Bacteroidales bacterium]
MKDTSKKKLINAVAIIACILGFALITYAYFYPVVDGKRIRQSDIMMHKGMSKEIIDYRQATGEEALWTNSMFGGMPAWNISVINKSNLMNPFDKTLRISLPQSIGSVFISMLGFFLLLLILDCGVWVSAIGGLAYGLASYIFIILGVGHNSKAMAMAYMAPVIAGMLLTYKGKYLWGSVLTAIALALEVKAGHLQITYYLLFIVIILFIAQLISDIIEKNIIRFLKATGCLIIAAILGVLTNTTTLYANYKYSADTTRGKPVLAQESTNQTKGLERSYITGWSYGIGETWSLMIPNVKGGASGRIEDDYPKYLDRVQGDYKIAVANSQSYWGDQPFTSGPVYVGAIVVFLFLLGALTVKGKMKWALLAATLLSILLSWGKNFTGLTDFFIDYIPGYNKFRGVSLALVIAEVCMPLLGFMGLAEVVKHPENLKKNKRNFFIAFGITAGICLLFYIAPRLFFSFTGSNDQKYNAELLNYLRNYGLQLNQATFEEELTGVRVAIFRSDTLRSLLFIVLAAIPVYLLTILPKFSRDKETAPNKKQKTISAVAFVALIALVLIDTIPVDRRYLNDKDFIPKTQADRPFKASVADQYILNDKTPDYRVLNLPASENELSNVFNDASTSYFHKSIGGYHAAKPRRYQDLINGYLSLEIKYLYQNLSDNKSADIILPWLQRLNMLNTKYIIYNPKPSNSNQRPEPIPIENPYAFGNAWIVNDVKWVATPNEEFQAIDTTNLRHTAVINDEFKKEVGDYTFTGDLGQVTLTEYKPNKLTYSFKAANDQLVVFSEIWSDTGWKLYVDGKEHPLLRANYLLRSALIPSGEHQIVMKYEPGIWKTGNTIQLASSSLMILGLVIAIVISIISIFRPKKEEKKA